jgi:hypothetical protein
MGSQQDLPTLSENGSLLSPFQQFADELDEIYTSTGKVRTGMLSLLFS